MSDTQPIPVPSAHSPWLRRGIVVIISAIIIFIFGPILAFAVALALWFNWFGLRTKLIERWRWVASIRPWLLAVLSFFAIAILWSGMRQIAFGPDATATSPSPTMVAAANIPQPTASVIPATSTPVPATSTPRPATATRVPPTVTPIPPTPSPAPTVAAKRGIGISRREIQAVFETSEIGFTFKSGVPVNGQPQVLGTSKNGLAMLQIVGPEDNVYEASMLVGVPNDDPSAVAQNAVYLLGLAKVAAPGWDGGVQWVTDNLKVAIQDGEATTTHDGLKFTLQTMKELGMVGLFIEGTSE